MRKQICSVLHCQKHLEMEKSVFLWHCDPVTNGELKVTRVSIRLTKTDTQHYTDAIIITRCSSKHQQTVTMTLQFTLPFINRKLLYNVACNYFKYCFRSNLATFTLKY